jgi:hypothetical protein
MEASVATMATSRRSAGQRLFRAAWFAILLGIALEIVALIFARSFGTLKGPRPVVADLVQKTSWSLFVCVGVAFGTAVARGRAAIGGLIGLIAGPAAFQGARIVHKSVVEALALSAAAAPGPSPLLLGALKGIEYGALGAFLSWLGRQKGKSASDYAFGGLACGIVFTGAVAVLVIALSPGIPPAAALIPRLANELLHPLGCAMVIYAAELLPSRLR